MSRIDDVLKLAHMLRHQFINDCDVEIDKLQDSMCDDPQMLKDEFILELADEISHLQYRVNFGHGIEMC